MDDSSKCLELFDIIVNMHSSYLVSAILLHEVGYGIKAVHKCRLRSTYNQHCFSNNNRYTYIQFSLCCYSTYMPIVTRNTCCFSTKH